MSIHELKAADAAASRNEWSQAVTDLTNTVQEWAQAQGWNVSASSRDLSEAVIGTYTVPVLQIDTPRGQLILEPIGRDVIGAEGRVDLYAWPTLYRVMLLRTGQSDWVVRTDSGLNWPQPWGQATFVTLAEGLLGAQ